MGGAWVLRTGAEPAGLCAGRGARSWRAVSRYGGGFARLARGGALYGGGGRSEKVRTYNFKENRVTDHRIGFTVYRLSAILGGDLQVVIDALQADERARLLKAWVGADLLVLDDLFLARRISEHAAELLQTLVHQRYKLRRSIVITSNRVVQDWGRYLGDATMATTILDRLMHRCAMLEFEGKSYRLKEAAARLAMPSD
jgi:hypothetical protein